VHLPSPCHVVHRGARILRVNFADCTTAQAKIDHMEISMRIIAMAEPLSILMLTKWGPPLCLATYEAVKRYARHNAPYVKASAVIGVNEFQRTVLWPLVADRAGKVEVFEEEMFALNWLAAQ
jgi:hypothetical protein